ncbi:MAG: hypothetical protein HBSAPP03_05090 [Phycisphaerae bacterium]|nr:MAG: hypothetical protein HBSAPP03_05090 [Phycisphaerae bacterium]
MRSYVFLFVATLAPSALAQPFTYQGELQQSGVAVNAPHDFEFRVFATAAGPEQMGVTTTVLGLPVTAGRFTATVDPGAGIFTGLDAWVEIAVRPAGGGVSFTTLTPRQKIMPAPYAVRALTEWLQPAPSSVLTNDPTRTRVFFNRTARLTTAEYFGFTAPVPDFTYGGMYINTPGQNALPFYGYSTGNGVRTAWTGYQGSTQTWFVHNIVDALAVESNGNVGIGVGLNAATAKLDVGGTARAQAFAYATPMTRTLAVPGAAFRAADSAHRVVAEVAASGTYIDAAVGSGELLAPLHLPDGCVLTNVTLYCYDNAASSSLVLRLYARPHGQFGTSPLPSPGTINLNNIQTVSVNPGITIDNATTSYYIGVSSGDWQGPTTSVFSATATYTMAGPE